MSAGSSASSAKVSKDLALLAPAFRAAVEAALAECNNATNNLGAMVYEAYRSQELQAIYYARGRTVVPPNKPVTNAPTNLKSWHGYGLAVDVVHAQKFWEPPGGLEWFAKVAAIFKKHGCTWGGDWTSADPPHFQWGRCKASPSDQARTLIAQGGVQAVWRVVGADDTRGVGASPLTPPTPSMAWGAKVSSAFRAKVRAICEQLDLEPDHLMACMAFESGRTFRPDIVNSAGSGAVGLIQFMPATAQALGTTTEALKTMTAEEQLDYVKLYFTPRKGRLRNVGDVYMAILWPAAIGKGDDHVLFDRKDAAHPARYRQNKGLDTNGDGLVTRAEASARVVAMLAEGRRPENLA